MTQNKSDNWVRVFQVGNPKRHKNGFTIYKVTSVVFPKSAPEAVTNIVVWKRFNDFKELHNSLKIHHKNCNISEDLPKLTSSKYFKRFEEEVIKERIQCSLHLLNFIGRHPALFTCVPFLQFFNHSYQVSDTVSDFEIDETNDNGNVSDSTSQLCNSNYLEKNQLNGEEQKDGAFQDERSLIDSDNSHLPSSEDESISVSEGIESLKPLDNTRGNMEGEMVTCFTEKPIKDSEMWVCVEDVKPKGLTEARVPFPAEDYLVEAGYHIGQAQKYEIGGEYESAFGFYKAAMACLLSGMSEDECNERRAAVQEKIKRYAQRAENAYALHLSKKKEEEGFTSCTEGLKSYKVLSVIDKVLLVLNTEDRKKYVIKVLEKSPCPVDLKKKTIIPYNVPYMVKLVKYFENENSIFLVLEHASRGRLWDYVEHCSHSYTTDEFIEYKPVEENYEERHEKSYFEIFKDYTAYTARRVFGYYDKEVETDGELLSPEEEVSNAESVNENSEVTDLVKNSQKLLESIQNTLLESDYVTDSLTKDLNEIESALEFDERFMECKRRSKSVARSRFERRFSSEEVFESRSRTASSSLDRSGQWSRLAAMLESAPVLSEATIREWAAEMFVALETLHRWGVTCRDLHPGNVLLDERGHLLLTFQLHWRGVDTSVSEEAVSGLYAAPETAKIFPVTPVADWWSYGALLFELLTGNPLSSCYPGGILSHTIITFPDFLSPEACSLLTELLRYDPSERLGGGINGSDDIKCHPFFNRIDWQLVYEN